MRVKEPQSRWFYYFQQENVKQMELIGFRKFLSEFYQQKQQKD